MRNFLAAEHVTPSLAGRAVLANDSLPQASQRAFPASDPRNDECLATTTRASLWWPEVSCVEAGGLVVVVEKGTFAEPMVR